MYTIQLCQKEDMTVKRIAVATEVNAVLGHVNLQISFPCLFFDKFSTVQTLYLMWGHKTIPAVFSC